MNNEDINNNISYLGSKFINNETINILISNDQTMNYNQINPNIDTINLKDIELKNNLIKENNFTLRNKTISSQTIDKELDLSSVASKIRSEIDPVPLKDIEAFGYYNNSNFISSRKLNSYKIISLNNSNSRISNLNTSLNMIGNSNRKNSNQNKYNLDMIISNNLFIKENNKIDESYMNPDMQSKFYKETYTEKCLKVKGFVFIFYIIL